jgi:hypothetical protein
LTNPISNLSGARRCPPFNPNTVAKAYGLLERDAVIETRGREGSFVNLVFASQIVVLSFYTPIRWQQYHARFFERYPREEYPLLDQTGELIRSAA